MTGANKEKEKILIPRQTDSAWKFSEVASGKGHSNKDVKTGWERAVQKEHSSGGKHAKPLRKEELW